MPIHNCHKTLRHEEERESLQFSGFSGVEFLLLDTANDIIVSRRVGSPGDGNTYRRGVSGMSLEEKLI